VRIWDISPAYLSRGSLLGEHRELHGLVAVVEKGRLGYARHPETLRWRRHLAALRVRHELLAAEMRLRGYVERTPLPCRRWRCAWPSTFLDSPARQLALLAEKYAGRAGGRLALPCSNQELWAAHRYSVLARDQSRYRAIGRRVARLRRGAPLEPLATELTLLLRRPPEPGELENAVLHMWGHVRGPSERARPATLAELFREIQRRALAQGEPFLTGSTALSELGVWLRTP
jgi:hypothetical protein